MGKNGIRVNIEVSPTDQDYFGIPTRFLESLKRYAEDGVPTGGFLRSVLENDLKEAAGRADYEAQANLVPIVKFIYNRMPSACWGSPQKVLDWLFYQRPEV